MRFEICWIKMPQMFWLDCLLVVGGDAKIRSKKIPSSYSSRILDLGERGKNLQRISPLVQYKYSLWKSTLTPVPFFLSRLTMYFYFILYAYHEMQ